MSIKRINEFTDGGDNISNDDLFLFMDDPSSGGITKKISFSDLSNAIGGGGSVDPTAGVVSNPSGIIGASSITNIVQISQADYDALANKDANTLYIIQ